MDGVELGRSINRLADELEEALRLFSADYPEDRDWTAAEIAGLQYRLAVLQGRATALQAATA